MSGAAHRDTRDKERFYEDSFASEFDAKMNAYEVTRRLEILGRLLAQHADPSRRLRILDGGCGTGRFARLAVDAGYEVVALDLGPNLLREVRKKCDAALVAGSALALPFRDASMDLVMSNEVIEHTPDPRLAVHEYARVLRPGGRLLLTCPNRAWRWSLLVAKVFRLRPYMGLENWPRYHELTRWAQEAGLVVERRFGFNCIPFQIWGVPRVIRGLDRALSFLEPWMINQGLVAVRPAPQTPSAA